MTEVGEEEHGGAAEARRRRNNNAVAFGEIHCFYAIQRQNVFNIFGLKWFTSIFSCCLGFDVILLF